MDPPEGRFDVYGSTDQLDDVALASISTRLEARGSHPRFVSMMGEYLDAMRIDDARSVLDIGCGTGVAARFIAKRPRFTGRVTGIDLSDHLIDTAQRLASEEGVGDRVDFRVGDSRSLDLEDGQFDAVVAHTLVSHVDRHQDVIEEIARVVKPGGSVAIFDGDYASLTFGNADPAEGKRFDEVIMDGVIMQPRVMRLMPRALKAAGLEVEEVFTNVICEVGKAEFWASAVESFRTLLPTAGVVSEQEAGAWADQQVKDSEDGVFFCSSNYLSYVARKPPERPGQGQPGGEVVRSVGGGRPRPSPL